MVNIVEQEPTTLNLISREGVCVREGGELRRNEKMSLNVSLSEDGKEVKAIILMKTNLK